LDWYIAPVRRKSALLSCPDPTPRPRLPTTPSKFLEIEISLTNYNLSHPFQSTGAHLIHFGPKTPFHAQTSPFSCFGSDPTNSFLFRFYSATSVREHFLSPIYFVECKTEPPSLLVTPTAQRSGSCRPRVRSECIRIFLPYLFSHFFIVF
jgi:hypothetical protein